MKDVPLDAAARLSEFKNSLERSLPGLVARVVLFGSRARGEARPESDYDLAVFLRDGSNNLLPTRDTISDHAFTHIVEGYPFATVVLPDDYLEPVDGHFRTELARRIARDGVLVL